MRFHLFLFGCCISISVAACTTDPVERSASDELTTLGCSSNPIYDDQGAYTGCITYIDGRRCEHDTKGLTELGCLTYCDGYPWTGVVAQACTAPIDQ
jgi:hypothetical protein